MKAGKLSLIVHRAYPDFTSFTYTCLCVCVVFITTRNPHTSPLEPHEPPSLLILTADSGHPIPCHYNFVISRMFCERNHTACKLWRLDFFHSARFPWDSSKLLHGAIVCSFFFSYCCIVFHCVDVPVKPFTCSRIQPFSDEQFPSILLPSGSKITIYSDVWFRVLQ